MIYNRLYTRLTLIMTLGFLGCNGQPGNVEERHSPTVKNVVLLIGDGMGLTQVSTRFIHDGKTTNFSRFEHIGLFSNQPVYEKITDSAAAATAFACGVKSYNGGVGVDADTIYAENLIESLSAKGMKTGVIATSTITHATPACFYAHVASRAMHQEIARQLANSEVDYFAGGGLMYFFYQREDRGNYIDTLRNRGFTIYGDFDGNSILEDLNLQKIDDTTELDLSSKYGHFLAFDDPESLIRGRSKFLQPETERALKFLDDKSAGFFLMVEGSQIDWGAHANNYQYVLAEMEEFDSVLGAVLDFAEEDGNTLVLVTADHETGGLALSEAAPQNPASPMNSPHQQVTGTFSTTGHTAALIPVFAYGPGAETFGGIYDNTDIFHKIKKLIK